MEAIFFPRSDYVVEICAHRHGKRMTYTDQTDQLKLTTSYDWFVATASGRGIKVGFFAYYTEPSSAYFHKALSDLHNGKIWIDQYSWSPEIRDKIVNHENITDEEFLSAYLNTLMPTFKNAIGYKPLALSYSYGVNSFSGVVCPLYLGARNSGDANCGQTDYGYGYGNPSNAYYEMSTYCNRRSSYRWYDRAIAMINGGADADTAFNTIISNVSNAIDASLLDGGWFSNFTHFHSVADEYKGYVEAYYDMLSMKNDNSEIYFAGYGEALAYLVYRQMIHKVSMFSPISAPNTIVIQLETRNTLGVDEELLIIPISVKFSTTGTPLAGHTIASNCSLISLGSDTYIVEIPFGRFPSAKIWSDE